MLDAYKMMGIAGRYCRLTRFRQEQSGLANRHIAFSTRSVQLFNPLDRADDFCQA
jgi:hypothetical protein